VSQTENKETKPIDSKVNQGIDNTLKQMQIRINRSDYIKSDDRIKTDDRIKSDNRLDDSSEGQEVPVYVLGCFNKRVTLYSQQVRALNLIYSLVKTERLTCNDKIAIIGAGAAGLTAAAAAVAIKGCQVTILEKTNEVLSVFRNNNKRWLHPRIYDWPQSESMKEQMFREKEQMFREKAAATDLEQMFRKKATAATDQKQMFWRKAAAATDQQISWEKGTAEVRDPVTRPKSKDADVTNPDASLPLMSWKEGTAQEVRNQLETKWKQIFEKYSEKLKLYLETEIQVIDLLKPSIQWKGMLFGPGTSVDEYKNPFEEFKLIIVAVGFGLEEKHPGYWEEDNLDTIDVQETSRRLKNYVVIGCGDGGLVDILRIRIRNFKHAQVIDRFFASLDDEIKSELSFVDLEVLGSIKKEKIDSELNNDISQRLHERYEEIYKDLSPEIKNKFLESLRVDTTATLIAPTRYPYTLQSSTLNRFLVFCLLKLGRHTNYKVGRATIGEPKEGRKEVIIDINQSKIPISCDEVIWRVGPKSAIEKLTFISQHCEKLREELKAQPATSVERLWKQEIEFWESDLLPKFKMQFLDIKGKQWPEKVKVRIENKGKQADLVSDNNGILEVSHLIREETDDKVKLLIGAEIGDKMELHITEPKDLVVLGSPEFIIPPVIDPVYIRLVRVKEGDTSLLKEDEFIESVLLDILKDARPSIQDDFSRIIKNPEIVARLAKDYKLDKTELIESIKACAEQKENKYINALANLYTSNYETATTILKTPDIEKEFSTRKCVENCTQKLTEAKYFLGISLYEQRKYSEALNNFREIGRLQPENPKFLNWLGATEFQLGLEKKFQIKPEEREKQFSHYSKAEKALKRGLEINERSLGLDHLDCAADLLNLASLYKHQRKYGEAEIAYRRILNIYAKKL
jgi:hypothetical protein